MTKYIRALIFIIAITSTAEAGMMGTGYQNGWKSYSKPQAGSVYGSQNVNQYGAGGSKSYGAGGGRSSGAGGGNSYGAGGGNSYGTGGGNSYGTGGGKNIANPWHVSN